ncbi:MAG: hypothetical protein ACTSSH_01550 [Candidatus Heimdallarchaeota archaeon]
MADDEQDSGIKDIKEIFYDNLDDWPTESLKKTLFRLRPEEGAEVYLNLKEGYHDLTEQSVEIEKKFRPKMTLRTRELKTELERWKIGGGAFFRVIGDEATPEKSSKLSIQYFLIWTRQLFPFQFGIFSIPFFLSTLFIWLFSSEYPAGASTAGLWTYLTYMLTGLMFICVGIWTVFEGLYKRFIKGYKNWKIVPDSMLGFVAPGVLLWTTAVEYAITELAHSSGFVALIPISGWLSLLVGIVILTVGADFFIRGEKSYVERFSHPMDYAPLLIFIKKDEEGNWQIDGAQFDYFHYKTTFIPKEKLSFHEEDKEQEHPWFLVDKSWHAFREFIKPNAMLRMFANLIFGFVMLGITIGVYIIYLLVRLGYALPTLEPWISNPGIMIALFTILPMLLVLVIWSRSRTREFDIPMWEDLSEKDDKHLILNHHLSYDRLRILWNLRNRDHHGEQRVTSLWSKSTWIEGDSSRLVARVKLQYPFDRYKDWHTIRDTQEELLSLISMQSKEEELRGIQNEIVQARSALEQQVVVGMQAITDELDEFYEEQQDEIEDEREEIMDKLEEIEESVDEALEATEKTEEIIEDIEEAIEDIVEEELDIPDIPTIDEIVDDPVEETKAEDVVEPEEIVEEEPPAEERPSEPSELESEFKIPDIPIDVEKEED